MAASSDDKFCSYMKKYYPRIEFNRVCKLSARPGKCDNPVHAHKGGHKKGDMCDCHSTCNKAAIPQQSEIEIKNKKKVEKKKQTQLKRSQDEDGHYLQCKLCKKWKFMQKFYRFAMVDGYGFHRGQIITNLKICNKHHEEDGASYFHGDFQAKKDQNKCNFFSLRYDLKMLVETGDVPRLAFFHVQKPNTEGVWLEKWTDPVTLKSKISEYKAQYARGFEAVAFGTEACKLLLGGKETPHHSWYTYPAINPGSGEWEQSKVTEFNAWHRKLARDNRFDYLENQAHDDQMEWLAWIERERTIKRVDDYKEYLASQPLFNLDEKFIERFIRAAHYGPRITQASQTTEFKMRAQREKMEKREKIFKLMKKCLFEDEKMGPTRREHFDKVGMWTPAFNPDSAEDRSDPRLKKYEKGDSIYYYHVYNLMKLGESAEKHIVGNLFEVEAKYRSKGFQARQAYLKDFRLNCMAHIESGKVMNVSLYVMRNPIPKRAKLFDVERMETEYKHLLREFLDRYIDDESLHYPKETPDPRGIPVEREKIVEAISDTLVIFR